MAKVSFTKLGLKVNQEVNKIVINGQEIEVKQYLPINDKLDFISNVLNNAHDGTNYPNWIKIAMMSDLEMMYVYTNINFTDKQKEDVCKLYDLLKSSGVFAAVASAIPEAELEEIRHGVNTMAHAVYEQKNSVLGILETVSADYSNLDLDATVIQEKLANPENLELLRNIMTKLG